MFYNRKLSMHACSCGVSILNYIIKNLRAVLSEILFKQPYRNSNEINKLYHQPTYIPLMNPGVERMLGCEVHIEEPSGNAHQADDAVNQDVFGQVTERFSPHKHMLAEGFIFVFSIVLTNWKNSRLIDACRRFIDTFSSRKIILILEVSVANFNEKTPPDKMLFKHLQQAGVRIVIKNFGTGIAGLSLLLQIPVDGLKIESQFMVNDPVSRHIVDNLADLARRLEIPLSAEGISSHSQVKQLQSFNLAYISGNLCGKSQPADIFFPTRLVDECQAALKTQTCSNLNVCAYTLFCDHGGS